MTDDAGVFVLSASVQLAFYVYFRGKVGSGKIATSPPSVPINSNGNVNQEDVEDGEASRLKAHEDGTAVDTSDMPRSSSFSSNSVDRATLKARSWLLSALISGVMSTVGLYYAALTIPIVWNGFAANGLSGAQEATYNLVSRSDGPYARQWNVVFISFCVMDLLVGSLDYRPMIDPLSGWAHHAVYIAVLTWFIAAGWANVFPCLAIAELPTLLLALGSIRPTAWRVDLPMGIAFALTRLGWFGLLVHVLPVYEGIFAPRPCVGYLLLALHAHWFRGWLRSYRKLKAAAAATNAGQLDAAPPPVIGATSPTIAQ